MNTITNIPAASPSVEEARGSEPPRRSSAKPQLSFADAAALASDAEQTMPGKKPASEPAASGEAVPEPGIASTRKRTHRRTSEESQAVAVTPLSDASGNLPVDAQSGVAEADPVPEIGTPLVKQLRGSSRGTIDSTGAGPALHNAQAVPSAVDEPASSGPALHPADDGVPSRCDRPAPKAAVFVAVDTEGQIGQKGFPEDRAGAAAVTPTKAENAEQKGEAVSARQTSETMPYPEVGHVVTGNGGDKAASKAEDQPSDVLRKAELISPGTPAPHPEAETKRPERARTDFSGPRAADRQGAVAKGGIAPAGQTPPSQAAGMDGRQVQTAQLAGWTGPGLDSSPGSPSAGAAPPAAASLAAQPSAHVNTTQHPLPSVGEQILDSVRTSAAHGERQVCLRLQPPELGTVTVRLREQGDHLEGTLEVGKSDTRHQIEQALPDVVRSLQEAGVPIRRFDVTSADSSGHDLGRGLPQHDARSGPHNSGQNREQFPAAHPAWPPTGADSSGSLPEASGGEGRVNGPRGRIDLLL